MTKNLLAVEIGNENMKLAVIHQTKDSYKITRSLVIKLSEKAYTLDGVLDPTEVITTLNQGLVTLKASKMKTALCINSLKKIVRTRDLPLTNLKELDGIVNYEAEQFLPYGIDQFYIDYRVIGPGTLVVDNNEKEKQTIDGVKVMIAALPKEIMDPHMQLLQTAGLKIVSVTLHTDSIYSLMKQHLSSLQTSSVICDIGSGSVNTVLFENKEFLADISSELGVSFIVESFSKKYAIGNQDAYDVLFGHKDIKLSRQETEMDVLYKRIERLNQFSTIEPAATQESSPVTEAGNSPIESDKSYMASEALSENLSEFYGGIQKEISRMMEFYRTRRFGAKIEKIYLCGGGTELVGLVSFLQERLEVNKIEKLSEAITVEGNSEHTIDIMAAAIGGAIGR